MVTSPTKDDVKATDMVKKPYTAPELQRWGSLRDITQTVGNAGGPDGGSGHRNRTRP
jgi:hypothetical protein